MQIWIFVASFFLILITLSVINYLINKEFKIETSWLALSLAPVIIWLITSQQLSEFSGFGLAFKLKEVTSTSVSLQLDGNVIEPKRVTREEKGGTGKIQSFIRNRVEALTLEVGKSGYYVNEVIEEYLDRLTPMLSFKYVVFENKEDRFQGIISGRKLLEEMRNGSIDLVDLIETGNISNIEGISLISAPYGISRQEALRLMDDNSLSELPIVDELGKFVGIVERDKITSSIVAQLVSSTNK